MSKKISFLSPIDGDMLCARDGRVSDGKLTTKVSISAPQDAKITVNGVSATQSDNVYEAEIILAEYDNTISAKDEVSGEETAIRVFWLPNYAGNYRVSLDDNIWFLRDIAKHNYDSIFENPFLSFFREVHEKFGTKVHINIYLKDDDDFTIAEVPDRYKAEWESVSDWIRLSFHAKSNKPDNPYATATYDEVKHDIDAVLGEVRRFAGESVIGPVTTLHWGAATVDGCRAMRDCGYKVQVADFNVDDDKSPVSYYLDVPQRRHMKKRFIWRDNNEDIIFVRSAIITDTHKIENIPAFLDDIASDPHKSPYMDLLIHEQYFYPFYCDYQPNYREKVLTAVQWAVDNGYKPAFLDECVFE